MSILSVLMFIFWVLAGVAVLILFTTRNTNKETKWLLIFIAFTSIVAVSVTGLQRSKASNAQNIKHKYNTTVTR